MTRALQPGASSPTPQPGGQRMHPADLAAHRDQRRRQAATALERDAARLMPRLPPSDRVDLRALCDAARDNLVPLADAHAQIRERISQLDRQAA